jgi:Fe-S oxidoreductase/FAD/FMN-containing dehydrogenase
MFGERANFDPVERKIYSHDIAALPSLIKPLAGGTLADAIVQPASEQEIVDLVRWANEAGIALTPRGKATSGYGGVVPRQRGVIVDFYRLKQILTVDAANQTVTVQAGIVWEFLDIELKKQGLTLRLFPSSAPGSTVGGWLAQGGAGFGSYQFGWFRDSVVSARVVLPTGEARLFSGGELDLISEAEGITGIITEVTLKVQADFAPAVCALAFPDAATLAAAMSALAASKLPVWSATFINPKMAELKGKVPLKMHHDHAIEHAVSLPNAYIVTLAYRPQDTEAVLAGMSMIAGTSKGQFLPAEIAEHEWDQRFRLMRVKRLGPSLIPTEVVVPLASLGATLADIEKAVAQPLVKEGVIIPNGKNGPEAVILGFIPHDQRKLSFNFAFPLALTVIKMAEKNGGRAYSTGMYFTAKVNKVMGSERVGKLRRFKDTVDPKGLMNPGKVLASGLLGSLLSAAAAVEPLLRPFGNAAVSSLGEAPPAKPVKGIPADVAWFAYACSQCGYCVDTCDQFYGRGWESHSPRGKWFWLREFMEGREKMTQAQLNRFLLCTTCELCNDRCSEFLPIEPSWMKLRGKYVQDDNGLTFPPFEMMKEALLAEGNIWAGYRKDRSEWIPADINAKHGVQHKSKMAYFAGCTASYVEQDIAQGTTKLLDAAGVDFTLLGNKENCCGIPMLVAGRWDAWESNMRENIKNFTDAGVEQIVTSCPACWMVWDILYPQWAKKLGIPFNIETKHYSEVLADALKAGTLTFTHPVPARVTWHDSCHIGRAGGIYEPPREMIKAMPGVEFVEMEHNREKGLCCGSVLSLIGEPPVAHEIGDHRLQEAVDVKADAVLALCPCCQFQLRVSADRMKTDMPVYDLARFCAKGLGIDDIADATPFALTQWAVFEKFVGLMTPQGFANLMGNMWPELIDAMPFKMGPMMRMMGKLPGPASNAMFAVMKPMFPILFPILLPMMMPKVMPRMLSLVEQDVPTMPDYMKEQMPDLMPKVMDSLMPKMLPDVVPLVIEPMVRYLQGK